MTPTLEEGVSQNYRNSIFGHYLYTMLSSEYHCLGYYLNLKFPILFFCGLKLRIFNFFSVDSRSTFVRGLFGKNLSCIRIIYLVCFACRGVTRFVNFRNAGIKSFTILPKLVHIMKHNLASFIFIIAIRNCTYPIFQYNSFIGRQGYFVYSFSIHRMLMTS